MVDLVTSSDYLTSVNFVAVFPTREYAACNEAIATEYPMLQGTWDYAPIDYAFKALNDSKLEELDPKYIQKQAKKATGFEVRSSDLEQCDIIFDQSFVNPWFAGASKYGLRMQYRRNRDWFSSTFRHHDIDSRIAHRSEVISPLATEGRLFVAEARSSDVPMLVHTTCMAGYNLIFDTIDHIEGSPWMRDAVRRAYKRLHLPFVYPVGFNSEYAANLSSCDSSFMALGFSMCARSSSAFVVSILQDIAGWMWWAVSIGHIGHTSDRMTVTAALDKEQFVGWAHAGPKPSWYDPEHPVIELKTSLGICGARLKRQLMGFAKLPTYSAMMAYAQADIDRTRIMELEAKLQEAKQEVTRLAEQNRVLKEKLDAMVGAYNRAVKKRSNYTVSPAEPLQELLLKYEAGRKFRISFEWGGLDVLALAVIAQITGRPAFLYRATFKKPELVETRNQSCSGPIRVGSVFTQHSGRTFHTPQEWRAYYEPIIARLDAPDASA